MKPLSTSAEEAEAIADLIGTKAITGDKATKVDIVQQMPRARIIHLATHGLLDDIRELGVPRAIALAPSPDDDGFLTTGEILELQLNAELVVLSACHTGQGRITGDGVIGLSRSLISSGASNVVVSLWAVRGKSTQLLMTEFYKNLLQRKLDKAQAMLTTMARYEHPRRWAAFTLIGEAAGLQQEICNEVRS